MLYISSPHLPATCRHLTEGGCLNYEFLEKSIKPPASVLMGKGETGQDGVGGAGQGRAVQGRAEAGQSQHGREGREGREGRAGQGRAGRHLC